VSAAWALEFAPVNVSVVFMQTDGNEHFCIASRSWFFEELARCLAEIRETFPWRVAEHLLPPEKEPRVWSAIFEDQRLLNTEHAPEYPDNKRMLLTQRFLRRLHVDTLPRPWDEDGNNATLVDSLNGYRVKELASHSDVFTMNVLGTHEQYLSRAVEHYAAWEFVGASAAKWSKPPNYSQHDRAVI
jgi:hypothetical protein